MKSMLSTNWKNSLTHLRLHFSFLLMPVFLFALSQAQEIDTLNATLAFLILHVLVYPSSNLYNGYNDRDTGSVGGLKNPPPPNTKMLILSNFLDASAFLASFFIGYLFAICVLIYIIFSRLYSYRAIRLKRFPLIGFLLIFIFQGIFTFIMSLLGIDPHIPNSPLYHHLGFFTYAAVATSFQIGAIYPLTQIYQHKSDLADGVVTLSFKLGYRGTFFFSAVMLGISNYFYYLHFKDSDVESFYQLIFVQAPIACYFGYWATKVWQDTTNANYKHTMRLNVIAATSLNLYFLYLIFK